MKRKIFTSIILILCLIFCALCLGGCGLFKNGDGEDKGQQGVSYGTATINYHYEYNVLVEHYQKEVYSIQTGTEMTVTDFYTPSRIGYRFLGWTRENYGEGEIISSLTIKGSGFGGTVYNLYA